MGEIKSFHAHNTHQSTLNACRAQCFFSEVYLLTHEELLLLSWLHNSSKTFFAVFTITLLWSLPHQFEKVFVVSWEFRDITVKPILFQSYIRTVQEAFRSVGNKAGNW